jgi:hypothetical protein
MPAGGHRRRARWYGCCGQADGCADRYAAVLREAGCTGVAVRQLDWRTWYGLPGHHIPLVAAARPPG